MFGIKQGDDSARAAKAREVRAWVRDRFAVPDDATVMVTELACPEPGCPPIETVVAVMRGPGRRAQAKVPRPVAEITRADIDALALGDEVTS